MARFGVFSLQCFLVLLFSSSTFAQLLLPAPNGQYAVVHSTMKLVDSARTDPYDPSHGKRNVMISLFYPVERSACSQTCSIPYMPPTTATYLDAFATQLGIPNGTFGSFNLQVCCKTAAQATKNVGKFPIVLFSPGLGGSRLFYTALAQTLASAGYAVVTMDHTFEMLVVEYPDGTFTPGLDPSYWDPSVPGRLESLLDVRVEDGRFVLGQLGKKSVVQKLAPGANCVFNTNRAAFYGHSFGGATALSTLAKDHRFVGGINIDGTQYGNLSDIKKAGLLFGRADPSPHNRTNDLTWTETWEHLKGWKRELGLKDSEHLVFGDAGLLIKLAGFPVNDAIKQAIGTLDGERSFHVITTYVQAFMDFTLKGRRSRLFEGASEEFPEVLLG